jgi:DNA-binding SARP family transcriptional activator/tetratricopeptide (TPR) repeat protein
MVRLLGHASRATFAAPLDKTLTFQQRRVCPEPGMIQLHLLGGIELRNAEGNEVRTVLTQPKRLALLSYLAMKATGTACRRDELLSVFWPELTAERARNALNKGVHHLRQALGDVIVSRGDELVVDASLLECDAQQFTAAVQDARYADAVEWYRGDLMPAFHIEDGKEFERWLDLERFRLRRWAARAFQALAQVREQEGQVTVAICLARCAADASDDDERTMRQLLELLDRLGDRAGALYTYDKFARRMRRDLGAEPSPETKAVIERVRQRSEVPEAARVSATGLSPLDHRRELLHALAPGLRSHGYEVEREIGRGGTATVYLAQDLRHDRKVALKVLLPEIGALRRADRFAAEIRVTAHLQHPGILPLFDSGTVGGTLFYVMPYVEGESLRTRLQREKQLPVAEAVALVQSLAAALEHAHGAGIVHRDIKPENVLLHDGQPTLADFGIALAVNEAGVERITPTGLSLGTPQYMSPEQAAGELSVGPLSDIYSLAAVAYEMLAGEPPFTGPSTQAVLARVMLDPPRPIRTIRSTVPLATEAAILRALAKHPADRFADATSFAAALASEATRVRARPSFGFAVRVAAVATTVIALGLGAASAAPMVPELARRWFDVAEGSRLVVADFVAPDSEASLAPAVRDVVSSVIQQSSRVTLVPREQLLDERRAAQLPDAAALLRDDARHVAHRARIPAVIDGRIHRIGDGYEVVLTAVDVVGGATLATERGAARPGDLSAMTARLARALAVRVADLHLRELPNIHWRAATPSAEAYRLFVSAYTSPSFPQSATTLEQALRLDSAFASAWALIAYAYYHSDRAQLAVPAYETALRHRDRLNEAERLYAQGMIFYRTRRPDSAVTLFDAALQLDPTNAELHHDRGMALRIRDRYDEATESFARAVTIRHSQPKAHDSHLNSLATTLALNGHVDSARGIARMIVDSSLRRDAELFVAIGSAQWTEARRIGRAVGADPTTTTGWRKVMAFLQASTLVAEGRIAEARRLQPEMPPVERYVLDLAIAIGTGDTTIPAPRAPGDTMPYDFFFHAARNAWRGDSTRSRPEVRALARLTGRPGNPVQEPALRFLAGWNEATPAGLRRTIDYLAPRISTGELGSSALVRFVVADAYERIGRLDSAAYYFDMIVHPRAMHFRQSVGLGLSHSFALRRRALLHERLGDSTRAREDWEWFLRSFSASDPEFRAFVTEAQAARARLMNRRAATSSGLFRWLSHLRGATSQPADRLTTYAPNRLLILPFEATNYDAALAGVVQELATSLPIAVSREDVAEPVQEPMVRDLLSPAIEGSNRSTEWLAKRAGAGLQLRGECGRPARLSICQISLWRMPGNIQRLTFAVTGDPSRPAFAAQITERVLVALYLQKTWGDRVRWQGEYVPRSLAAARAYKQACCQGRQQYPFYGQAALLDTAWATTAAWAAFDSSRAIGDSIIARLQRRPDLPPGERESLEAIATEYRLPRQAHPGHDADHIYELHMRRLAVNPEWWTFGAAYWALATGRPNTVLQISALEDSLIAPRGNRLNTYSNRAHALHQLGRYREQLDVAREIQRRFPNEALTSRTHELAALAALGQIETLRSRLSEWTGTPEPERGAAGSPVPWAGTRDYIAGMELLAHGREREGLAVLAAVLPFYENAKPTSNLRAEYIEILLLTGRLDEARRAALSDLRTVPAAQDSATLLTFLGVVERRLGNDLAADRYFARVNRFSAEASPLPRRASNARAWRAGWMGDRESAVRLLEDARSFGTWGAFHHFVHREPAFAAMRTYPPFRRFLRPRD